MSQDKNLRAYDLGDTILNAISNTSNNTEDESVKYTSHDDADLLNITSINNNIVSSIHNNIENNNHTSINNSTIDTDDNLIDLSEQSPIYNIDDKVLFKNNSATITNIIKPEDPFQDDVYVIKNNTGMIKVVTIDQTQINNVPQDIVLSTPSASASLQSTDVSYRSIYTKRSMISFHSLEIINRLTYDLEQSKKHLHDIKSSKIENNNIKQPIIIQIPVAQLVYKPFHSIATVPVTRIPSNVDLDNNYSNTTFTNPTYKNKPLTELVSTIAKSVLSSISTPVLKLPNFNSNDSKSFLLPVITQIQSTLFYRPLMNTKTPPFVCTLKVIQFPAIDNSLYISLAKYIPSNILKLLHLISSNKSGTTILTKIQSNAIVPKNPNEVDIRYSQWCNITRGPKESL